MNRSNSMIPTRQGVRHIRFALHDVLATYGVTAEATHRVEEARDGNFRLDDKVLADVSATCAIPACTS